MFTSSLCDISVAAKDKTLLRNKLGHLDRIELDCLLIRVCCPDFSMLLSPTLSSAEKDKGVCRFFKAQHSSYCGVCQSQTGSGTSIMAVF